MAIRDIREGGRDGRGAPVSQSLGALIERAGANVMGGVAGAMAGATQGGAGAAAGAALRTFGAILAEERAEMGLTAQKLANKVGCRVGEVAEWEADRAAPSARQLRKLYATFRRLRSRARGAAAPPPAMAPRVVAGDRPTATIRATTAEAVDRETGEVTATTTIRPSAPAAGTTTIRSPGVDARPQVDATAPASPLVVQTSHEGQYTRVEVITPDLAELLLTANVRNRPISQGLVDSYARDMREGNWHLSHQGIAIDKDARMCDGQHRLRAVVESGCTIRTPVTYNVDPTAFETIDGGRSRSMADVFGLKHGTKRNTMTVAALKVIDQTAVDATRSDRYTFAEVDALWAAYGPDVSWAAGALTGRGMRQAAIVAALAYAWPTNVAVVEDFARRCDTRLDMTAPMTALLRAIERLVPCRGTRERVDLMLVTLRCLHAHERGEEIKSAFVSRRGAKGGDDAVGGGGDATRANDTLRLYRHYRAKRERMGRPG